MPKQISSNEVDAVLCAAAQFPEGGSLASRARCRCPLPHRTLQRRLATLIDDQRLIAEGRSRGTRYRLPAVTGELNVVGQPDMLEASGEVYIPISPEFCHGTPAAWKDRQARAAPPLFHAWTRGWFDTRHRATRACSSEQLISRRGTHPQREGAAKFWTRQPPSTAIGPTRSLLIQCTPCSIASKWVVILPKLVLNRADKAALADAVIEIPVRSSARAVRKAYERPLTPGRLR